MQTDPLISIITPVYNGAAYIDDAVRSVVAQTFENWELILVNDGSEDDSLAMCMAWSGRDVRIKTISMAVNSGAGAARNMGIELAKGKYITFMDIDDSIDADLYENVMEDISRDKSIDMVVWGVTEEYTDSQGEVVKTNVLNLRDKLCNTVDMVRKSIIFLEEKTLFGYQWNHLYRKELITDNNIRFENVVLYEDYFFNLAVINHVSCMKICSDAGYHYKKRHSDNVTNRFVPEYFELSRRRVKSMVDLYKSWELYSPSVKRICGNRYLRYILSSLMRNNMQESDMSHRDKKVFVEALYGDELYRQICFNCSVDSKILNILRASLNKKHTEAALTLGRAAYFSRVKMPGVFSKNILMK